MVTDPILRASSGCAPGERGASAPCWLSRDGWNQQGADAPRSPGIDPPIGIGPANRGRIGLPRGLYSIRGTHPTRIALRAEPSNPSPRGTRMMTPANARHPQTPPLAPPPARNEPNFRGGRRGTNPMGIWVKSIGRLRLATSSGAKRSQFRPSRARNEANFDRPGAKRTQFRPPRRETNPIFLGPAHARVPCARPREHARGTGRPRMLTRTCAWHPARTRWGFEAPARPIPWEPSRARPANIRRRAANPLYGPDAQGGPRHRPGTRGPWADPPGAIKPSRPGVRRTGVTERGGPPRAATPISAAYPIFQEHRRL